MRRVRLLFVVALMFLPGAAHGLQLHWSSGADTLTFSEATRATLVLRADSAEETLPPGWRLLWVGDSTEVEVVALDSLEVCAGDTAQVYDVDGPSTPDDSTAHRVKAHFCSGGSGTAEQAAFQLDLPAWGRGKCKVVALDPVDSTSVLESNEVTFNGGGGGDYQPVVFAASQSRSSDVVSVTAVGAGLTTVQQSSIVAFNSSWVVPLTLGQRTSSSLTATAYVPASLPPALLEVAAGGGQVASAPLSGDEVMAPTGDYSYGKFVSPEPNARPKDFSFFYDGLGHFHLFYMRQCISSTDTCERRIAHVWGTDLRTDWSSPDIASFTTDSSHSWDAARLWAPSLLQRGPTYYLFYTGVNNQGDQSIGVATTGNINTARISWNRPASAIVTRATGVDWTDPSGQAQCRDPFVMEDPADSGQYVMFYTAQLKDTHKPAIGIARSPGADLTQPWNDGGHLEIVDVIPELYGPYLSYPGKTESSHAFAHINARGDTSYYVIATGSDGAVPRHARLLRNRRSPWDHGTDTGPEHWNLSSSLYDELGFADLDEVVFGGWEATEYCRFDNHEYLAAINATIGSDTTYAIWIVMLQWLAGSGGGPDQMTLWNPVTSVEDGAPADRPIRVNGLRLSGRNPGGVPIRLEVALMREEAARLDVYDAQGRRVRTLLSGLTTPGRHGLSWDGRDAHGSVAPKGLYFARLGWAGGQSVVRFVLMR